MSRSISHRHRQTHTCTHTSVPTICRNTNQSGARIDTQAVAPFLLLSPASVTHTRLPAHVSGGFRPQVQALSICPKQPSFGHPLGLWVHTCGVQPDVGRADQGQRFEPILEVSLKPLGQGMLECQVADACLEGGAQGRGSPGPTNSCSRRRTQPEEGPDVLPLTHRAQDKAPHV